MDGARRRAARDHCGGRHSTVVAGALTIAAAPSWGELAIIVALIVATYALLPLVIRRLGRRFPARQQDFDFTRQGASLRMAGGLVLGWGIIALAFQWWWFSAVAVGGGVVLLLWGRMRSRR